jgi:hypothetical protein
MSKRAQEHEAFLRVKSAEVDIKILSAVVSVKRLKDAELVAMCGRGGVWNVILN